VKNSGTEILSDIIASDLLADQEFAASSWRKRRRTIRGDDARQIAAIVGRNGRVVGIDPSETMIAESNKRTALHGGCGGISDRGWAQARLP
jgi:hypothetical protein